MHLHLRPRRSLSNRMKPTEGLCSSILLALMRLERCRAARRHRQVYDSGTLCVVLVTRLGSTGSASMPAAFEVHRQSLQSLLT